MRVEVEAPPPRRCGRCVSVVTESLTQILRSDGTRLWQAPIVMPANIRAALVRLAVLRSVNDNGGYRLSIVWQCFARQAPLVPYLGHPGRFGLRQLGFSLSLGRTRPDCLSSLLKSRVELDRTVREARSDCQLGSPGSLVELVRVARGTRPSRHRLTSREVEGPLDSEAGYAPLPGLVWG